MDTFAKVRFEHPTLELFASLESITKPIVAAVNGYPKKKKKRKEEKRTKRNIKAKESNKAMLRIC